MAHYDDVEENLYISPNTILTPAKSATQLEALQELLAKTNCEVTVDGTTLHLYDKDLDVGKAVTDIKVIDRVLVAKVTWLGMLEDIL